MGQDRPTGARGCRLRANQHGHLTLYLHYTGLPGRTRWSEGTGLPDTLRNRGEVQRKYCEPISAEMRAGTFTPARYEYYFPHGTRSHEFRGDTDGSENMPTLRQYALDTWLARYEAPEYRGTRVRDYRQHLLAYVLDAPVGDGVIPLGDVILNAIRRRHVAALRDHLKARGLREKTGRNVIAGTLSALFNSALDDFDEQMAGNPCVRFRWTRKKHKPDPFTADERDRILDHFEKVTPKYYRFVAIQFGTGMRPSEVTPLRLTDFDERRAQLTIDKSRVAGQTFDMPKTDGSDRVIIVPGPVADLLRTLKAQRIAAGAGPNDYLFVNAKNGGPIDQGEWAKTHWGRALDALGIRRRKAYSMKHSFLSIEVEHLGGRKLIELAAYCGTSVSMLEKHYVKRVEYVPTLGVSEPSDPAPKAKSANLGGKVRTSRRKTQQNEASPTGFEPVLPT